MRFNRSVKIRISYTERIPAKRKNFSCIYKLNQVHRRIKSYQQIQEEDGNSNGETYKHRTAFKNF